MNKYVMFMLHMYLINAMTDDMWYNVCKNEINGQKALVVVVPTYNNSRWCIKNIESIIMQQYDNYHVYIIDDCSTDDTYEKLQSYIIQHRLEDKVTLRRNAIHQGPMANWYHTIHDLEDHLIVLNIDGDDWLPDDQVFVKINKAYHDRRIWMTFGQFKVGERGYLGFCRRHAPDVIRSHEYRSTEWLSSHLRTYYVWLFKKIDRNDFMYQDTFFPTTCDRAIMYPLLEMCAGHYYCFEDDVLYIYNAQNPLAEVRIHLKTQKKMNRYIQRLPAYKPLADVLIEL